ncbi:MAG: S8 family serine peptidase [Verrucomicrobia bacterium]|nr:S8 family serine peptidase [Verrucomicrobiota bacterium]
MTPRYAFITLLATALVAAAFIADAEPDAPRIIPGQFIVTLKPNVDAGTVAAELGIKPKRLFQHALRGFAGNLSDAQVERLQRDPRVSVVEPDEIVQALPTAEATVQQTTTAWGLDRINQRNLPLDGLYSYDRLGAGVTVYVIDTGIRYSHQEVSERASFGFDAFGGDGSDCIGHGTWVAGIIGGLNYGVAKQVNLVSVRVFDCSGTGTASSILAGVDWVTAHHVSPAVANMSLTVAATSVLTAVQAMVNSGVATAVAAGNGDDDSCLWLFTTVDGVMATAGSNASDTREYSTYGSCIDWFAPGINIPAASHSNDFSYVVQSGTSAATAFSSGRAALYLEGTPSADARGVRDALYAFTTKNVVKLAGTENNHLLYAFDEVGLPPAGDITAPAVVISSPANGATVPKRTTLTVTATASDNVGVTKVDFYLNGVLTATDSSAPYAFSFKTDSKPGVNYKISARALDAALNLGIATTISVTTK